MELTDEMRGHVLNVYTNILIEQDVSEAETIAYKLELGTHDYALMKGNDNDRYILNYYNQIFIKMIGNLQLNKNRKYVINKIKLGEWDPINIPSYPREVLYPEKWDSIHKETEEENKDIVIKKKGAHRCPRCKSWYTTHTEVQLRAADESMDCKCHCNDCYHNWKF